jgi:hypothetical protein
MIGRFAVFVMLAEMVWAWDNQVAFASQEPHHCSVVGDLEVRPFTSRVFHNTRKLRVWLPPGYKNRDQRSERYGDAVTFFPCGTGSQKKFSFSAILWGTLLILVQTI